MIEFEGFYPIGAFDNITFTSEIGKSVSNVLQLKGTITTYIEQIEEIIDQINAIPKIKNLDNILICPDPTLIEENYYSKSFSCKVRFLEKTLITLTNNKDLITVNSIINEMNKINRLRVIFTHSSIKVFNKDLILLTNRTQKNKDYINQTIIKINSNKITVNSYKMKIINNQQIIFCQDDDDLIYKTIREFNNINNLLSYLKEHHNRIKNLLDNISYQKKIKKANHYLISYDNKIN